MSIDLYFLWNFVFCCSCNSNSRDPAPLKIAMAGGDFYVNQVLRPYVEQFSAKSHDWWNYIKFLYIPLGKKFTYNAVCFDFWFFLSVFLIFWISDLSSNDSEIIGNI